MLLELLQKFAFEIMTIIISLLVFTFIYIVVQMKRHAGTIKCSKCKKYFSWYIGYGYICPFCGEGIKMRIRKVEEDE